LKADNIEKKISTALSNLEYIAYYPMRPKQARTPCRYRKLAVGTGTVQRTILLVAELLCAFAAEPKCTRSSQSGIVVHHF